MPANLKPNFLLNSDKIFLWLGNFAGGGGGGIFYFVQFEPEEEWFWPFKTFPKLKATFYKYWTSQS